MIVTFSETISTKVHSCPEAIDLADVINEHPYYETEIKVENGNYFANDIQLIKRELTLIGLGDAVILDLGDLDKAAFVLNQTSLTLVSFPIKPSTQACLATALPASSLNLTGCKFGTQEFSHPILVGTQCELILNGTKMSETKLSSSLIEAAADAEDHQLRLTVDNCNFTSIEITAQKPVLAGPDVEKVTVFNSTFQDITCSEDGPLPTEAVQGVANRSIIINASHIQNVDGALSGALVFGVQASSLTLKNLTLIGGANAVRFSGNVAFDKIIEIKINSSDIQNTTTSELWPSGGFLYLPQDQVNFTMNFTNISFSSAPNGNGGFMFIKNRSTIYMERCVVKDTSAGKSGGFIRADEYIDSITLEGVPITRSTAGEDGGALHLTRVQYFKHFRGGYTECNAGGQGGAIFFEDPDRSGYIFSCMHFLMNYAKSNMGNDVLFSFSNSDYYSIVTKKNFYRVSSNSTGNKVTFLPKVRHIQWTDTFGLQRKAIIAGVVIGVCVFVAACIVLTCVCCCCGCCIACGCGRKKATAYQHVESQPRTTYTQPQTYPNQYPPQPAHPSQYPQQYVYTQPAAQPSQMQQYPSLPPNQMGVDASLNKM
ncbi:hypothetical protein BLNAU_5009 [Blattamonas nauphoetae]|uniref:Right handed beta helix domain-containing protein n=1 Tax=Blattamonas nauphoetae TaxID=2049346 RepID=A0ABQ9Y8U6_9EUKA|nr:hypothetical protein BLNAU_5009 [Blattamonas nauphoetae]